MLSYKSIVKYVYPALGQPVNAEHSQFLRRVDWHPAMASVLNFAFLSARTAATRLQKNHAEQYCCPAAIISAPAISFGRGPLDREESQLARHRPGESRGQNPSDNEDQVVYDNRC